MDVNEKIQRWIEGLQNFDLWQSACDFYKDNEEELVEMNVKQLQHGLTPESEQITPEYGHTPGFPLQEQYYWLKRNMPGMNRFDVADRDIRTPNLGLHGGFYSSITIQTDDDQILFTSTDPKWANPVAWWDGDTRSIQERYGNVLGIPADAEKEVDERRNTSISDQFRKIFD